MPSHTRSRISPETVDKIVELRLAGKPVREICEIVNVAPNTVHLHYKRYLERRAKSRQELNEHRVAEIEDRLELNWLNARNAAASALVTDDPNAVRYLETERKALEALTKFTDRVGEPEHAQKVTAAQATAIADVIRDAAAQLPAEQRNAFLTAAVAKLKNLD